MEEKKVYVIEARKYGLEKAHSYVVGVFDNKQTAIESAQWHADYRCGRYGIKVFEYTINKGDEALNKSDKQLCVYEIKSPYEKEVSNKSVDININTTPHDKR